MISLGAVAGGAVTVLVSAYVATSPTFGWTGRSLSLLDPTYASKVGSRGGSGPCPWSLFEFPLPHCYLSSSWFFLTAQKVLALAYVERVRRLQSAVQCSANSNLKPTTFLPPAVHSHHRLRIGTPAALLVLLLQRPAHDRAARARRPDLVLPAPHRRLPLSRHVRYHGRVLFG